MVRHCNRLPREMVKSPVQEVSGSGTGRRGLVRVTGAVLGGRLNRMILKMSSNRGDSVNKGGEAPVSRFGGVKFSIP